MQLTECFIQSNGLELCVEERGNPQGIPIVLIMGLGGQLTLWPDALVDALAAEGYRVIRFDNRDIGLSSQVEPCCFCNVPLAYSQYALGLKARADYSLYDMADDTLGILDALQLPAAHIVGASMGGMIAQILAARYPHRVSSLTLLMTSTNDARMTAINLAAAWHLCRGALLGHRWESFQSVGLGCWRAIQSPKYPAPDEEILDILRRNYERSHRPWGILRQVMAIAATGSLRTLLPQIPHSTQIIHGDSDPLLRPIGAQFLAKHIPESQLSLIPGMGHDLPNELLPQLTDLIHHNVLRGANFDHRIYIPAASQMPAPIAANH